MPEPDIKPKPAAPTIFIIRKKREQVGHNGAAWKVAYADFVTAMMALFIVLWLLNTSDEVQKSIAAYFHDPKGFGSQMGSSMSGHGEGLNITKSNMDLLKSKIEESLKSSPKFEALRDFVQMTVTGEGLRIELLETDQGMFFEKGQLVPTDRGKELLEQLAHIVGAMPNSVVVEGHTDARPYGGEKYTNWELSIGRANTARNIMVNTGLRADQVAQVRGFADQQLRLPDEPYDPSNRRVSIIVEFPEILDLANLK